MSGPRPPRRWSRRTLLRLGALALVAGSGAARARTAPGRTPPESLPRWSVFELPLSASGTYANPYTDVTLRATFVGPGGKRVTVRGFWDGGQLFRVRFTPTAQGLWRYTTLSNDPGLAGRTGSLVCTAPPAGAHGFVRRDAAHPAHFVYDDGTRHFMFGTTLYEIVSNAVAGDAWQRAVEGARSYGVTKARLRVHVKLCGKPDDNPYPCTSPYGADHDHLDMTHFQALDRVVQFMLERGMVADLMPFDSDNAFYGTDEQDERFLRYVIARYAAFPNVIWCLSNEYMSVRVKPAGFWNTVGGIVRAEDPFFTSGPNLRPLSIHCCGGGTGGNSRVFHFFGAGWPVHAILQAGRTRPGDAVNRDIVANLGHGMPVVDDEFGYMGDTLGAWGRGGYDPALHRSSMWAIYAAGGYASSGDKTGYADGRPYHSANWHDRPEYGDIRRLTDFFTAKGVEYWKMASANTLVRNGERVYVLAEPGRQYVAYAAAGGRFALDLAPGRYAARVYNPRDGSDTPAGTVEGRAAAEFSLPDASDWVVYLRALATSP